MATPDYSKIWGANSPLAKYEFTEADYLRGWEFIGSMPPARTMFDAWMRKADEKMRWLYDNAFSENSLGGFLFWRLPDTAYFVGEKRALQDGPLDVYIECTIAGRTSKEQIKKLPQGAEIGKTFVDGTATWLVRQFVTSAALDDHRKKTPLDHPDGSVLKKHLGFTVYDKGETDARLNTKANANHGYHVPSPEVANNTRFLRNDNTWQPITAGNIGVYTKGETNNLLNSKAPLASPALTGVPTAPTAERGTNSTQLATTAFVARAVAALVNSAPGALDTLQELAKALGNDANFATTMTNALAGKLGKSERAADSAKLENRNLQWILEQIKAANTGIVASNLEPNGWIKFANGLIVQWGIWPASVQEKSQWFTFPLAFSAKCLKLIMGTLLLQEHPNADLGYQVLTLERSRAKIMTQHFSTHILNVLGQIKAAPEFIAIGI